MIKKNILLIIGWALGVTIFAQERMFIHKTDNITLGALIAKTDSVNFSTDGSIVNLYINNAVFQYSRAEIDSITFGANDSTVYINYNGTSAFVINPLAYDSVAVAVSGADVIVTATGSIRDVKYSLSGTTIDGMFKVYSQKRYSLILNGVNITNASGPAINLQSDNRTFVTIADGTTNTLTDAMIYATAVVKPDGNSEDQDAAFFSEGKIDFSGTGSLTINGKGVDKHALCTDDKIDIASGTIIIASALKDGIHANEGIKIQDGTLNVTASNDAIDGGGGYIEISGGNITTTNNTADTKGISCDSILTILGGTINMTVSGLISKGIKSGQDMTLSGGTINITSTGGATITPSGSGYDPAYSAGIKCDETITVNGASISITTTGAGGKGIKSDKCINITSGSVIINASGTGATYKDTTGATDTYFSTCISSNGNVNILGGTINIENTGLAGKGIAADDTLVIGDASNSPTITVSTTGEGILLSGSGQNANYSISKALKGDKVLTINNGTIEINSSTASGGFGGGEGLESFTLTINEGIIHITATDDGINTSKGGETMTGSDGSGLYINGGNITINTSRGDGIDCNGNIVMTSGTVIDNGPSSAPEEGLDFNGTFNMFGGYIISSGSNSMFNQPLSASSTQRNMYISSSSQISAGTIFHIQDASGNDVLTFKPVKAYYSIIFSSSMLTTGVTYSIYTGGSYSGGTSTDGLYSGGTYSSTGATLKKSVTLSTSSTANTITF